MSLAPGTRLGAYEVVALLGAGGMGEVYRARDTRLNREVAIKILPDLFAEDANRVARFQREAKVLASLNHPNIAQIHGLEEVGGHAALVLELVDGPTLADLIAKGPIPAEDALPLARQIAEALEAAHEHGIIHRDLKPANIKVTLRGTVKVLDFGLAKAASDTPETTLPISGLSQSPTLSSPAMTMGAMILGTAAYMSPEQAKGKPVDRRADIWAFGCVLYEMLTGTRAFRGDDVSDVLAAILKEEPDWRALPPKLPPAARRLLLRCIAKDSKRRLASASDALLEIDDAVAAPAEDPGSTRKSIGRAGIAAGLAILVALIVAGLSLRPNTRTVDRFPYRTSVGPPPRTSFGSARTTPASFMAISPDGRKLAFVATDEAGKTFLWVQPLDATAAVSLAGTEGAREPFWSADSTTIAFIADEQLKKVSVSGGPVFTLATQAAQTGAWNSAGVILYVPTNNSPLHRISAAGGVSSPVTELDADAGERTHDTPMFLPDGEHFLYMGVGSKATGPNQSRGVFLGSLTGSGRGKLILDNGSNVQYASGHLVFLRDNVLLAQRFNLDRLALEGEPRTIAEDIATGGITGRGGAFSLSQNGVLVYQTGKADARNRLVWFDRTGKPLGDLSEPANYTDIELSRSGKYVAAAILDPVKRSHDIWIVDVDRKIPTRFTFDAADEVRSAWSSNNRWLAFSRRREGTMDLFRKPVTGPGEEEKLVERGIPMSWSPDDRQLLFVRAGSNPAGQLDIWVLPLDSRKPWPYLETSFTEPTAAFSPDGKWVAYASNESGSMEAYIDSFPEHGRKVRVSADGARFVQWHADGRELFYLNAAGSMIVAEVFAEPGAVKIGRVQELFRTRVRMAAGATGPGSFAGVSPDGQRFLLNISNDEAFAAPLTLVLNWPALVTR